MQHKLKGRLSGLLNDQLPANIRRILELSSSKPRPDIYTGFREFSYDTLGGMVGFFSSKSYKTSPHGVWKTMLNKLLWYSDFVHYRQHAVSISGAPYVH